ncbi:MAG: DUF402 domain-containing protein [Bacilli bacterium]|nr:DUF402 domain-containing protein [Bacilli bacterium]
MIKRKRVKDVYMREVTESEIKTKFSKELNAYITYKYVIDTTGPARSYVNGEKRTIVDKGYTVLEYSPVDEEFNCRVCIDKKGNILQYYFDVIEGIEMDKGELYYNDLFLDVVYHQKALGGENYISLLDENELRDAFNNFELDKDVFDHCYEVAESIMKSIKNNTNKFINRGTKDYLEMKEE